MKFSEIADPLTGERTVAVVPTPAPQVDASWQRQHFVTGRTVSAPAMQAEQQNRAGHVVITGQALRPGVISGLQAAAELDEEGNRSLVSVAAGMGICASGEDVILPRGLLAVALSLPSRPSASQLQKTPGKAEPTLGELIAALKAPIIKLPRDVFDETPPIFVPPAVEVSSADTVPSTTESTSETGTKGSTASDTLSTSETGSSSGTVSTSETGATTTKKSTTGIESPPIVVVPEPETFSESSADAEGPIAFADTSTLLASSSFGTRTLSTSTSTLTSSVAATSTVAPTAATSVSSTSVISPEITAKVADLGLTAASVPTETRTTTTTATTGTVAPSSTVSVGTATPIISRDVAAESTVAVPDKTVLATSTVATATITPEKVITSTTPEKTVAVATSVVSPELVVSTTTIDPAIKATLVDATTGSASATAVSDGLSDRLATSETSTGFTTNRVDSVLSDALRDRLSSSFGTGARIDTTPTTTDTTTTPPKTDTTTTPPTTDTTTTPPKTETPAAEATPPKAESAPATPTKVEPTPQAEVAFEAPTKGSTSFTAAATGATTSRTASALANLGNIQTLAGTKITGGTPIIARPTAPFLAVLTVEPIYVDALGAGPNADDCCERDPESEPFEDWRLTDGVRLMWIPVDTLCDEEDGPAADWITSAIGFDASASGQRNRISWAIFDAEARLGGAPMPWEKRTVPVALVAFDWNGKILWVDTAAVVRRGGRREEPDYIVEAAGDEALWQARVEQFNGQMAELPMTPDTRLNSLVRWLPPAGVLPREIFDFDNRLCRAFPMGWGVSAAPIPLEQIDQALRSTSALAPFDLSSGLGDELKLLLPIHQAAWDPELLNIEAVHTDFHAAMDEAEERRDSWMRHRSELRAKIGTLWDAIGGADAVPVYPEDLVDDTEAMAVADAVLWKNNAAIAQFALLGERTPPLLANATQYIATATAMVGDATLGQGIGTAFFLAQGGPVVAVPTDASATPTGISGPGFTLDCGWTHPFMATTRELALRANPALYLVAGTLDTESLDRAIAFANGNPLVVIATGLHDRAAEELIWHNYRGHDVPAVAILGGPESTRADRLADIRLRLGATKVASRDEFRATGTVMQVVMSRTRTAFLGASGGTASTVTAQANAVRAAMAGLAADDYRIAEYEERLRVLEGQAAGIRIPDRQDGSLFYSRGAYTIEILTNLRAVTDLADGGANGVLGQGVGTLTEYGTVPLAPGLGVELLEELKSELVGLTSAPDGLRVITDEEVAVLDDLGIAGLIGVLSEKAKRADDAADFSFLQVQAAIFRLREQMLGRDKATRMASSPVLAGLAKLIDSDTSPEQLGRFFTAMQQAGKDDAELAGGGGGTPPVWLAKAITYEIPRANVYSKLAIQNAIVPTESLFSFSSTTMFAEAATASFVAPAASTPTASTPTASTPTASFVAPTASTSSAPSASSTPTASVEFASPSGTLIEGISAGTVAGRMATPTVKMADAPMMFSGDGPETFVAASGGSQPSSIPLMNFTAVAATKAITFTAAPMVNRMIAIDRALKVAQPVHWNLRSSGVKDRVEKAIAIELRQAAFRLRATITQTIFNLELNLNGVKFPGFLEPVTGGAPKSVWKALTSTLVEEVLQGKHEIETQDGSEADLFSAAVRSLEIASAMLRVVESRIREVQGAINLCRRYQAEVEHLIRDAEVRIADVEDQIAEARHDVTNTVSLLAEERERVDEINARRAAVLAEHVPFVVFHRGRVVELVDDAPVHDVEPALRKSPALEALRHPAPPAPDELHDMVDLWREVQVAWIPELAELLKRIDRADALRRTLELSRRRAAEAFADHVGAPQKLKGLTGMQAVSALFGLRKHAVITARQVHVAAQPVSYHALTWKQIQVEAPKITTIGDLLSSPHVRSELSRSAARALDGFYKVAANLYRELGEVQPHLRAAWVRLLSEYDDPMDLQDLSVLPRWAEVGTGDKPDPFRKRELQSYVSWLFAQINPHSGDAVALMNDLVRVCILLASHAPVGRIIAGHVETPTPVEPDRMLPIRIDPARVRIGMIALVMVKDTVVARGVVEDLGDQRALARITSAAKSGVVLQSGDSVRFVEADGIAHAAVQTFGGAAGFIKK